MIVINLWGAPGSGKSTAAAFLYSKLKAMGVNAELVTEFAKDLTWEERNDALKNQLYVSGNQAFRISRLDGKVDVVITDSPLPLGLFYLSEDERELFRPVLYNEFYKYDNINILMIRDKRYIEAGRLQSKEESNKLARDIYSEITVELPQPIYFVKGNRDGHEYMLWVVTDILKRRGIINDTQD